MSAVQQLLRLKNLRAFWLTLSLFCVVLLSNMFNLFQASNAFFYQNLESLSHTQQTNVVLITSDRLTDNHQQLVEKLFEYQPRAIVVLANESLVAPKLDNVYYPYAEGEYCVPQIDNWATYQMRIPQSNELECKSIWQQIFNYDAEHVQLIDFDLAVTALPKFSAERVLNVDVMSEQLENKIIIIGQKAAAFNVFIHAPKVDGLNDPLLLMAYLADSIDKQTTVKQLNSLLTIFIELALVFVLLFSFQKLSLIYSFIIALNSVLLWCLLGYFFIEFNQLFIPIGQYIVLTFITLFWVIVVRKMSEDNELNTVVNNIQQKMMGRFIPQSFIEQASPWDPIIQLISQQLDLEKSIFLARKEDDHRVVEIRAINCNLDDIQEMRRDYKRTPYSKALKSLGVVQITRPFFTHIKEGEIEFMAPLVYAGDVRGFWALSVIPNKYFNQQAFEKNVNKFAAQVAELLFHYHIFKTTQASNNSLLNQLLTLKLHEPISEQVKQSINEMEQKLTTLEMVFNHTRSATVLFNLFGQVIQTNASLEQFAKQHQLAIFEMTALDLLCKSCDLDAEIAKGKLRYITLNKAEVALPAKFGEQDYTLNIKALHTDSSQAASGEPFQVSGILFEFIDNHVARNEGQG
ncbi:MULTISPECIES: hypothetical protein [Pseudoalteromonas]|uniref:hypothetical protein n=1 Tax=Pseudoalteromonas TaxID=53246 RepID=UPI001583344A|nr:MULTISPECIES: hypothetical protein [Pseudoalteromonas]MDI4654443.1 hypothetical protein [Pseudoalteromonas shioyasakiensis]NUJ40798.1 hypothetical protein [Pseudoalteromonas sp. 0303]